MENLPPNEVLKNLKKKKERKEKWRKVNHARYTMIVIGLLLIFSAIAVFIWVDRFIKSTDIVLYMMIVLGGIHIGLSVWAKHNPTAGIIAAITIFSLYLILAGLADSSTIFEGLWWKILILGLYIRGLLSVKDIMMETDNSELLDDF